MKDNKNDKLEAKRIDDEQAEQVTGGAECYKIVCPKCKKTFYQIVFWPMSPDTYCKECRYDYSTEPDPNADRNQYKDGAEGNW